MEEKIITKVISCYRDSEFEKSIKEFYEKYSDLYEITCHYTPVQNSLYDNQHLYTALMIGVLN